MRHTSPKYTLLVVMISVFACIVFTTFAGTLMYYDVTSTYTNMYTSLTDAGLSDVVSAPTAVSRRFLFLVMTLPLLGAALLLPAVWKVIRDVLILSEHHDD